MRYRDEVSQKPRAKCVIFLTLEQSARLALDGAKKYLLLFDIS